ncbi:molecular chaperone DnaK [Algoriphagus taiwanensis]|uniref:Uncharacterized protein n=1 Tax=Algoriphagus taiwanensis TaxID=1445656 RepID=A0ABQ6Q3F7_9BACT|nr:hypothetical protein Ataiwa_23620 [Algoriphagus taiwanensis]
MKISKEDFEQMKAKYDKEVKKGKAGKDKNKEIDDQTNWIYYTKEDIMEALGQEGATGIKFHFIEYTEEVAKKYYGDDADLYVGRLGLVFSPIFPADSRVSLQNGDEYFDRGNMCPPKCE